jgi:hypothetical protein
MRLAPRNSPTVPPSETTKERKVNFSLKIYIYLKINIRQICIHQNILK